MNFLKKAFAPKEVKAALGAPDEAAYRFQTEAFQMVRRVIEKSVLANPDALVHVIRESGGRTPREWVYSEIGNIAGDMLESGQYPSACYGVVLLIGSHQIPERISVARLQSWS